MIYLNGKPVNVTIFPDNTSQVWKLDERHFNQERVAIRWEFSHEGEFMHLAQLNQLLKFSGVNYLSLHIGYLPYGRQDKMVHNNATFALWSFSAMLNDLNFNEITILDPHSDIALATIRRSKAVYPHQALKHASELSNTTMFCYPDNGALIKYVDVYNAPYSYIYGKKVRDQSSGHILEYHLIGDCEDQRVLIVDDICDGGKTFEILANDLYAKGAEEVNLFVTHGILSKGLKPLKNAGIKRIFTNKGEAITMADGGFGFRKVNA